ncbi:MAG: GDSL-type esterase/lipase family protein [Bacteroidetes bacterium]|nr:GDSL-type esterase/lipase family protein [Bacteroidota bacterium]MCL2303058.1 GDSL-type esterase/lipase family protein [Lentimicrobiaceae bacterium]
MKARFNTFYRLLFIICASWSACFAQPKPVHVDAHNFINYKADTLYIAQSNPSFLQSFITKFDSVVTHKSGNINIIHIGGSHVQAGTFPHAVRQELLKAYPDLTAGRGLVFPYAAAPKCNNPTDYRTRSVGKFGLVRNVFKEHVKPLGVAGIAVYTLDSISEIRIVQRDSLTKFKTTKITLIGYAEKDSAFIPILKIDTATFLPTKIIPEKRQFIYENICTTDSFTFSLVHKGNDSFTITGILLENENPGITYHSIGVNGASVNAFLRCAHFEEEIPLLSPDMVIFGLGINDASESSFDPAVFKENYLTLVNQFKKVNPNCFFVFITNNDSYKKVGNKYEVNRKALDVRKIMYELANETGGAVFDQFEIMGGLYSMEKWRLAKLAQNDRVHFTKTGYELMGKLLFNAIIRELQ